MQLVLQERPSKFLLHEALALRGVLPVGEADFLHDIVNVRDDALDDDVRVGVLRFLEEFCQRFFGAVALLFRVGFFLGFDDFLRDFEDLFEELQAGEEALLVALLDSIGIPILRLPSRPRNTRARWGEEGVCCGPMMGWME